MGCYKQLEEELVSLLDKVVDDYSSCKSDELPTNQVFVKKILENYEVKKK